MEPTGAHALVAHKTMQIRARQEQQRGLLDVDDLACHADDWNRPAPEQVVMTAHCVRREVVNAANIAGVEDARVQGKTA
jgi:hypothetical protein